MPRRIGSKVKMTSDAIDNYGEQYAGKVFTIAQWYDHVGDDTHGHRGYDASGGILYHLKGLNFDLYDWELTSANSGKRVSNPGRKRIVGVALNPSGKFLGFIDGSGRIRKGRVRRLPNPGYELFYGSGGHGGPYPTVTAAVKRAKALLRGSRSESEIQVRPYSATGTGGYGGMIYRVYKDYATGAIRGERR